MPKKIAPNSAGEWQNVGSSATTEGLNVPKGYNHKLYTKTFKYYKLPKPTRYTKNQKPFTSTKILNL